MKFRVLQSAWVLGVVAACLAAGTEQRFQAVDPGVRHGAAKAGGAVAGVDAEYFANLRFAFQEVHSIAGDIEPGADLGPRFNGTSCGGCHAYPAAGGSSPEHNPQLAMAAAHGARNRIPPFVRADGPVMAVRVRSRTALAGAGAVLPLFTVNGRVDAYSCSVDPPDFSDFANLSFRIPTPVFGAGLIENIPDAAILANRSAHAAEKRNLGIEGEPNLSADGAVGKFGWKAQQHSLRSFAGEAYETEMGIPNETSNYRRGSLNRFCYSLYEAAYDDPNYSATYDGSSGSPINLFTEYMRFLKPPAAVKEFGHASAESIRAGRGLFESVGCALCHTPSLHTGNDSELAALNGRDARLYSDLLLHHMGPKLADDIVQGHAGADQFRTAPLWGLGQRIFLLHDGRTADLLTAIRDHAGASAQFHSEADAVVERFQEMPPGEQQDILNFLRSL